MVGNSLIAMMFSLVLVGCSATEGKIKNSRGDRENLDAQHGSAVGNGVINLDDSVLVGMADKRLIGINQSGEKKVISKSISVTDMYEISVGILVKAERYYIVKNDGSVVDFEVNGNYRGENLSGQLFFSSAEFYDTSTNTVGRLSTNLSSPEIGGISGNFVLLRTHEPATIFQIYDTATKKRYNTDNCNGSKIVALSPQRAIIDDCHSRSLFDFTTGKRSGAEVSLINGEHVAVSDGAVIFDSAACNDNYDGERLCFVDAHGKRTLVSDHLFDAGPLACCGDRNQSLFVSGDDIIIKELNGISHVRRDSGGVSSILANKNVHWVTVLQGVVYYTGETSDGNFMSGVYHLRTDADDEVPSGSWNLEKLLPIR